ISIDEVLAPVVLGRAARLHPVVVIFCIPAGALLYGVAGVIMAVPCALAVRVTLARLYEEPLVSGCISKSSPHYPLSVMGARPEFLSRKGLEARYDGGCRSGTHGPAPARRLGEARARGIAA